MTTFCLKVYTKPCATSPPAITTGLGLAALLPAPTTNEPLSSSTQLLTDQNTQWLAGRDAYLSSYDDPYASGSCSDARHDL
ncbi:hypothetical protein GCM10028825_16090 [Spirosoma agri]